MDSYYWSHFSTFNDCVCGFVFRSYKIPIGLGHIIDIYNLAILEFKHNYRD